MSIKRLYIELTDRCNLNCAMCYRQSWSKAAGDMTEATYQKLLESLAELNELEEVVLGGVGEPTVSELFYRAVNELSHYKLTITTNGIIEEKEKIEVMAQKAARLVISVDGLEERFSMIRGANLEQVCSTIRELQYIKKVRNSATPEIYLQFVISSDNWKDLLGVVNMAAEMQVKSLIVSNLVPMTLEDSDKILYSRYRNDELKGFMDQVCRESMKKGIPVLLPHHELKTERKCSYVETASAFVCASGEVSPCHRFSHRYDEYVFGRKKSILPHSFGNISEKSLKDIWDSRTYSGFRDMVSCSSYPSCTDCDLADGCDFVRSSSMDCNGNTPACADCLWSRKIAICI